MRHHHSTNRAANKLHLTMLVEVNAKVGTAAHALVQESTVPRFENVQWNLYSGKEDEIQREQTKRHLNRR